MNRTKVVIGLFLIAILGVLGGRFGLPWLIERQVAAALDDHIAGLPDSTGARYAGLSLDYWNDELRLTELRLPVDLPGADGSVYPALVSVRGIHVDGYDWPRLETALQTGWTGAPGELLIRQVSWRGVTVEGQASGEALGSGGEGRLEGMRDLVFDPADGAVTSVSFDALSVEDMVATPSPAYLGSKEGLVVHIALPSAVATGWRGDGADSIVLTGIAASAVGTASAGVEGSAEMTLEGLSVTDWQSGDSGHVGAASLSGLSVTLNLPESVQVADNPEVARMMRGPLSLALQGYQMADVRYDPRVLDVWRALIKDLAKRDPETKPEPEVLIGHLESFLVLMERARDLDLGTGLAEMVGLKADFGEAASLRMERFELQDAYGLRGGSFDVRGFSQKGRDDNNVDIARYHGRTGDYAALPAWLRTVFGEPLSTDSLEKARAWAAGKSLAELVPVIDLGSFAMEGMDVIGPDGKPVRIDLTTIERMRIGDDGLVEVAFRMDGISGPLEGGSSAPPQAAMLMQMLKANGVEDLRLGTAFALKVGLADSTGALVLGMSGEGLAQMTAEVDLTAIDFEKLRAAPAPQRNMVALSSSLARAQVTLTDEGLRKLLLESQAAQRPGATAEMIGAQFGAMAEQMGASMGTDASRAIGQQLAAFITRGGMLELSTGLQDPLPIIRLLGLQRQPPASIIGTLGLSARHTAP